MSGRRVENPGSLSAWRPPAMRSPPGKPSRSGDLAAKHDDGTPAFNGFIDGLKASRESGTGGHLTVIGHSYGSTLILSAARKGELNADDVVFGGSPGVRVGETLDLDVPQGHVWNEEADGDPVPDVGKWGHGGSQWEIGGGALIMSNGDLFGGNQMIADATGRGDY
ncbi:alpha/beta hydrolase [Streptomyces sp. NPDC015125]|uniref:alpha/beta hydrolase n=1 Tax=Streptomyces sp. NPDC015125 TaxID=3364938 RepID=UPI0036FC221C